MEFRGEAQKIPIRFILMHMIFSFNILFLVHYILYLSLFFISVTIRFIFHYSVSLPLGDHIYFARWYEFGNPGSLTTSQALLSLDSLHFYAISFLSFSIYPHSFLILKCIEYVFAINQFAWRHPQRPHEARDGLLPTLKAGDSTPRVSRCQGPQAACKHI